MNGKSCLSLKVLSHEQRLLNIFSVLYITVGVALLPVVDEGRLLSAVRPLYEDLTEEEKQRAVKGSDRLFVSKWHPAFDFFTSLYEGDGANDEEVSTSAYWLCIGLVIN